MIGIPTDVDNETVTIAWREVRLTNLRKLFWPELGITKGALIQDYADVAGGGFFFMKRAPTPRPPWIRTCSIDHDSGNIIDFPVIDDVASRHPVLMTSEYRVAKRPKARVLVDDNQNRWGSTLASIYSVRPTPRASVSTPIMWEEAASGVRVEDFRLDNVRQRLKEYGDLWKPLLAARGRTNLETFLTPPAAGSQSGR